MTLTVPTAHIYEAHLRLVRSGHQRRARRCAVATVSLLLLLAAMLMLGNTIYPVSDVLAVVVGQDVSGASFTVGTLRIPRAITGALAGIAFGTAGTTFLALLAGIGTAAIYLLARSGESTGGRLTLIGIGAMLNAVVALLVQRAAEWDLAVAMRWLTGSLNGARLDAVPPLAVAIVVLVPIVLLLSRSLNVLELGDAAATALGVITGVLGAPYLLYLLIRTSRRGGSS